MTTSTAPRAPRPHGVLPRLATTAALALTVVGTAVGVGAFGGTPVQGAGGGLLSADATPLAPAGGAFSIWSLIYLGLAAYTIVQWWDPTDRHRIRVAAILSMLLNALWILVVQAGMLSLSVLVIVVLLTVLAVIVRRLTASAPRGPVEAVALHGTFGLYLGWVCVATCANIAAALLGAGLRGFSTTGAGSPGPLAVGVVIVAAAVGTGLALSGRRSAGAVAPLAAVLAVGWGLAWIAVGRLAGEPASALVGGAAAIAAAGVVIAGITTAQERIRAIRNAS